MRLWLASWTIGTLGKLLGPPASVTVGDGVEIRAAGGKGLGAFVTRALPAGAYLSPYTGTLMHLDDATAAKLRGDTSGDYHARLNGWFGEALVVDAEDEASGWPRYINHSRRRANCENFELRKPVAIGPRRLGLPLGLYVQLRRDVAAGEELLVDYGDDYWDDRGLRPLDPRRIAVDYL